MRQQLLLIWILVSAQFLPEEEVELGAPGQGLRVTLTRRTPWAPL